MKFLLVAVIFNFLTFASTQKDAFSGSKFFYIDANDRAEILTDLYKQTKAEYALWEIKKRRLGIDPDQIFKEAIDNELTNIAESHKPIDQAKANLDFFDRVKEVIAKFEDTHFGINAKIFPPFILSGFNTSLVNGKIYITGRYDKVISKTVQQSDSGAMISLIELGDELVSVNGISATEAAKSLEKYISGSSKAFTQEQAAKFVLERYFAYPSKPYVDIEVMSAKYMRTFKVRLPFYYSDRTKRKDSVFYFKNKGFLALKDLRMKWNEKKRTWEADPSLKFVGLEAEGLPSGAIELENYTNQANAGSSVVRSALILDKAQAYGFLQINSFAVKTLYKGSESKDFVTAVQDAVKYFKEQGLKLIVDLRHNGGGNGGYPGQVLSAMTEMGKVYQNTTWAKRITRYSRQFIDYYASDELFNEISNEEFWQEMVDQIYVSTEEKRHHTPAISNQPISAAYQVGGFDNDIVALISPSCVSACDIMSMLFKNSKRATLIGTHSNGTGAGYWSNSDLSTQFQDRYHIVSTQIPNSLFGYPGEQGGVVYGVDSAYELNSENVPAQADVQYVETLDDYKRNSSGWIKTAIETLNK
jgi:hypothetical protein